MHRSIFNKKLRLTDLKVHSVARQPSTLYIVGQGHSHVVDLDVSVIGGGDEQLGVRGEGERSDGHGMT